MSWTRRRLATVTTGVVVVAWVVFYAVALANADQLPDPVTAVVQLAVPPLLWVALLQIGSAAELAARLVVRHWRSWAGSGMSALDPPGRLLAAAVRALPERRHEWGRAMLAELAEVRGRSARWRFALSSARATLWLPPAGGWPVLALVTGVAVAATTAAGPAVGAAVPGLTVFAVTFTGLVGAMVVLAVARSRRVRLPVPVPTWFLLTNRLDGMEPPFPLGLLLGLVLALAPFAIFLVPAFAAGKAGRSLRTGLHAAVWTVTATMPLTYALWLPEALRRHAIDGRTLDGELVAPVGVNLEGALIFCLGIFPVFGLTLGMIGASLGTRIARPL